MSIEKALADLTAALEANTAALKGAGAAAATFTKVATPNDGETKTTGRGKGKTESTESKPKHTKEEMIAALNEVKENKGLQAAKDIISKVGGVTKMADIAEAKIDSVYDAAKQALGGEEEEGM